IDYNRYNLNATVTSQVQSWVKLKANTKYTQSKYTSPFSGFENLFFHNLARMRPNVSPYDLNGNWTEQSMVPYLQSGSEAREDETNLAILTGLEFQPVKKWKINVDLNLRQSTSEQTNLKLPGTIYGINGAPITVNRSEYNIPLKGSYGRNMLSSRYISPNIYSSYSLTIKENHGLDILVGFQQELNEFKSLAATAQDLISNSRPGISLATGSQSISESRTHWATRGGFARLSYNYKSKYLLELNGRYDGSSRFAADSRWGFFPSVSAGYNLDQETFLQEKVAWLNQFKIRGSYGFLGNQSGAGLYSYAENMGITVPGIGTGGRWYYGAGREAYITVPGAFNPFITWEKIENANVGLDFGAFNSQLTGSFDIYQRNTRDMLGPSLDIADMYGATPPQTNNADLRTRGWELSLNWRGRINSNISYSLGGLLADNKSVVTKYQNPNNNDPRGAWYVGKTAGEIWGFRSPGLVQNPEAADAFNRLDHSFLSAQPWKPGDVIYEDLNNDGKINQGTNQLGNMGDLTIIGNSNARYSYSLNGSVSWKGLSLSMLWQGVGKRDFAPALLDAYFWGSGSLAQVTVFKEHLDYWTPENPGAYYPNPYASPVGSINSFVGKTQQISDRYLQNAAYLRLKNLTINYNLPVNWVQRVKLSKVNVFFSGENLLTQTKLAKMFDPETLVGGAAPGKIYPLSKIYSFGLGLSF
ncbi:MAG: SusC/RagA family TonB-linked outer membrane protein, partial [Adhaeribacter sp.]